MKWYKLDYVIVGAILLLQFGFIKYGFDYWYEWDLKETAKRCFMWAAVYTCILIGYYIFRKVFTDLIDKIADFFTE